VRRRAPAVWHGPALILALLVALAGQRSDVGAQISGSAAIEKLTTVLADLAQTVPQAPQGARPGFAAAAGTGTLQVSDWPASARDAMRSGRLRLDASNAIQVYVLMTDVSVASLAQLTSAGARVELTDLPHRRVQARISVSQLQAVAALTFVSSIRLPSYAVRRVGSAQTEGDAILHADAVRQQLALDGSGIKVGVISDGIKGVFAKGCSTCGGVPDGPIASGDLPGASGKRNAVGVLTSSSGGITGQSFQSNSDLEGLPSGSCGFAGAGAEGTALLEIVHDLAPGAQLSFANADTSLTFNEAVNALAASNDVVVDDLGFFDVPFDGTSSVSSNTAAALNRTSNRIRAYVTSVGNGADEHYLGAYTDSGVDGTTVSGISNAGRLHLFAPTPATTDELGLGSQPYNLISLPQGGEVVVFLNWDDPAGASANNYDLYLVRQSTNTVVARGTDVQRGSQDAIEFVDFTNAGSTDMFRIVVQNVNNRALPRLLNLFAFQPQCATDGPRLLVPGRHARVNYNTIANSVIAQSDAGGAPVSVISVGAICSGSPAAVAQFAASQAPSESCNDPSHATIEFYSSRGPTFDGRMKPDVTAIDGVQVTGAGSFVNPFFGTSAAAPHVAAEAALLLQGASCLGSTGAGARDPAAARSALRNMIVSGADPVAGSIPDNVFGFGLANVFSSAQKTLPAFGGAAAIERGGNVPGGARLTPADLGFTDPNQCPMTKLAWTGGCGTSPDAALTCPFGTSSVSVSASNSGVAFSPAVAMAVTVTNFSVAVSPGSATVSAGQSAAFQVTVTPQGGAFGSAIKLGCPVMPQGANCSFSPASVVPGSDPATSVMTITTTGHAPATIAGSNWWPWGIAVLAALVSACALRAGLVVVRMRRPRQMGLSGRRTWRFALGAAVVLGAAAGACVKNVGNVPVATMFPASLTFPNQGVGTNSAAKTVTLANTGAAALAITSISAAGDFSQTNTCGSLVAPGSRCTMSITFAPSATGQRTGAITISSNAVNNPQTVALSGAGGSPAGATPAGTFAVSVHGTSGSLVQSAPVTLVVR